MKPLTQSINNSSSCGNLGKVKEDVEKQIKSVKIGKNLLESSSGVLVNSTGVSSSHPSQSASSDSSSSSSSCEHSGAEIAVKKTAGIDPSCHISIYSSHSQQNEGCQSQLNAET